MGDHDDGVLLLEFHCQVLNLRGGNGVQGGGGLVHQKDFRFVGQGPGNAQPLLLAAGEAQGALLQTVLDLVPNGGVPEGFLHDGVQIRAVADAVGPGAVGHVVVNGHGEGIGLLEHHADLLAQPGDVQVLVKDVLPFEADVPLDMHPGDQVVHPVQGLQEGRLAAAGGADEGSDLVDGDVHVDVLQRVVAPVGGAGFAVGAVPQVQGLYGDDIVSHD